jgi:hypothetical protein
MERTPRAVANRRSPDYHRAGPGVAEQQHQFARLEGACLKWEYFGTPHARFGLLATGLSGGDAAIQFLDTQYVECPSRMRDVRLRLATDAEVERLQQCLIPDQCGRVEQWCDYLAIDHEEGVGYVVAGMMFVQRCQGGLI